MKKNQSIQLNCGFLISNTKIYDDSHLIMDAFSSRIDIFEFIKKIGKNDEREELLKAEEASIMMFCNNIYFMLNPQKQKYIRNSSLIKLLNNNSPN
jgi:hypothetical protein